jgi:hypothetical protein
MNFPVVREVANRLSAVRFSWREGFGISSVSCGDVWLEIDCAALAEDDGQTA